MTSNSVDVLARAKRIENAINATAVAYTHLGAQLMELSAAVSDFFKALSEMAPAAAEEEPLAPKPPDWKM